MKRILKDKMFLDVFPVNRGKQTYYCKIHKQEDAEDVPVMIQELAELVAQAVSESDTKFAKI